jgi:hypothetical protein
MSQEELEAYAKVKEERRVLLKAHHAANWHCRQMATNYDDYITASNESGQI